ncbi:hypothetical protein [Mycolicibacterium sp.]|uniref:endonuclease domain-containing protein n=1 Tax=Mycolicibacterium sp. TaxID=2320850 RepID=UPI001A23A147|nr:hypothetical protein [Mycolicibacterium sp.]MBJ7341598.1 hypothetical protein [Mycolicibacterium sp.]
MERIVVGSELLASGRVNRHQLRTRFVKLHRNVYAPIGLDLTARDRAYAAWLWSGREAVLVGSSAAAMLGTKWLSPDEPAELARSGHATPPGIIVRADVIADDELCEVGGIPCTTAARTAYDIGRRIPRDEGIIRVDALLNATRCGVGDVEAVAARHAGARGIAQLRRTLAMADGGAESPRETRLRLLLDRSLTPRLVTQIPVADDSGRVRRRIDMGYPQWMVGVEYDGEQHFDSPRAYANDIVRLEFLAERGWTIVRVSSAQLRYERAEIVARVHRALVARGWR